MNNGVKFVLDNCEKTLKLVNEIAEFRRLKPKVVREYYYLKSIKCTGNMYEHFLKYKNGKPYLESHHVITLADGGPDVIYNTIAICPNCHRKIHVLNSREDTKKLKKIILDYLVADEDNENIAKYNALFNN